jgi:hypothetical protein
VRTDITLDQLEPDAPPLGLAATMPRMKPLSVGAHSYEVTWVLSAQHCDGLGAMVEENCLPAGALPIDGGPVTVSTPAHCGSPWFWGCPHPLRGRILGGRWADAAAAERITMRSIHFRVEDDLYRRLREEAEQQDFSIASFARVATVARTLLWAVRRGAPRADVEAWGEATTIIQGIERRDVAARAKLGRERRMGPTFTDKLKRERPAPPSD